MSYTPGPWEISTRATFGWDVKVKNDHRWICGVFFEDDDDKKADALLIAASPELLEALELAQDYVVDALARFDEAYERHPSVERERNNIVRDLNAVHAAIAKARGQK